MKLLAFDLDGTIVTRDRRLPDEIAGAIRRAEHAGHHVTVVTGRTEVSARPYLEKLGLTNPYGTCQGARVATATGDVLVEARLPPAVVRAILDRHGGEHHYFLSSGNTFYVADPDHAAWDWARAEGHEVTAYHAYGGEPADKIVFSSEHASVLHDALLEAHPDLMLYPWDDRYLEVTTGGAHKGEALRRIAETLSVPREDVIAFGDGVNDVTMLDWAGWGVAVGTADPRALAVADEHIAAPEDLGVARWLETKLLAVAPR